MKNILLWLMLTLAAVPAFSQSAPDKQKAKEIKQEAVRIMDNGDPDRAITLLETAQKADPDDHSYLYEIGYAYYIKKDFPKAIATFRETTTYPDATDQCYQMLGNAYDDNGERAKARDAYMEGLKKFPSAGRLYMECGLTYLADNDYNKAIGLWEKGVAVEPRYSSNYYRLAKLFARSNERVWAAFYGELFMNVERNTKRTEEISQLLFDVYKQSITFVADSNKLKLDMTSNVVNFDPKKPLALPFGLVYTMDFIIGLAPYGQDGKKEVSIGMLSQARIVFIDVWYNKQKHAEKYPNVLLDFQRTLNEKGWLDAYTYWLLMKGNEEEFLRWRDQNRDRFEAFATWFNDHPLMLDKDHFVVRTQYDK